MNRVDIIGSWRQSRPQWLSPILSKGIIKPPPKKNLNKKKERKTIHPSSFFFFSSDKDGQITGLHVSSRNCSQAPGGRGKASDLYLRVQNFSRRRLFKTLTPSLTRRKRQKKQTTTKQKNIRGESQRSPSLIVPAWATRFMAVKSGRVPAVLPPSSRRSGEGGRGGGGCFFVCVFFLFLLHTRDYPLTSM